MRPIRQPAALSRSTLGESPLHRKRSGQFPTRRNLVKSAPLQGPPCMQFHRFDLNLLIALDTLLREKNITRAAEKVFVSQPAMSAALHRLRDYFDDPLLVRVGRDM